MVENHNMIENQLVILTKQTIDVFLKQDNPADLIALYTFYYYTAKWQSTNQIRCTTGYVANGLKWSEAKVRKAKSKLIELGVIEDIQARDSSNKIIGHYIKMNYIIKQSTVSEIHTNEIPQGGKEENHPNENPQGGIIHRVENRDTNALSNDNINALNNININALSNGKKETAAKNKKSADAQKSKSTKKNTQNNYSIYEDYAKGNEDLKQALIEFDEMRKSIKKPMTDRAKKMILSALDKLSNDDSVKVRILEQSILHNWQTVYALKDDYKQQQQNSGSILNFDKYSL